MWSKVPIHTLSFDHKLLLAPVTTWQSCCIPWSTQVSLSKATMPWVLSSDTTPSLSADDLTIYSWRKQKQSECPHPPTNESPAISFSPYISCFPCTLCPAPIESILHSDPFWVAYLRMSLQQRLLLLAKSSFLWCLANVQTQWNLF